MGKAQSKRSVDITTETKKGTEDEITEKMGKIEDLDKKEVVNGDATISEKSDQEKKDIDEVENDKDMTTEKEVDVQASGDATDPQNVVETSKDEGGSAAAEEISPLADESIKKSKKEKVKKKWSFRSISFGKKDKQKPAKSEDAAEDGNAAINGADSDEKTNEPEDTQKEKSANENEGKTTETHENGNATQRELNEGDQNEEKLSDEKSIDITANATNNTTTTEKCEPVQNETAAVSSELSEKTENTAVINETKPSENTIVDDASKNGNIIDEKKNATDQEPQKTDVTSASAEAPSEKTSPLANAVTNESLATTNGEVIDQIHQNGDHGESEQAVIEKSKAQIEVNSNTDNNVSAATLDSIPSTSTNPSNVQFQIQDLNPCIEKPDEIVRIDNDEPVIQKSSDPEIKCHTTTDQFVLNEIVSMVEDVENTVQVEEVFESSSETVDKDKSAQEKLAVDSSPPPLPISPPPSQVSVFAFTNNDESVEDSIQTKNFEPAISNLILEEKNEIPLPSNELPTVEIDNSQETDAIPTESETFGEKICSQEQDPQILTDEADITIEIQSQENKVEEKANTGKDLNIDNVVPSSCISEESQIEEEASVAFAATMIDEITETAAQIVNQQLECNKEQIMDAPSSQNYVNNFQDEISKENIVCESNDNKTQNDEVRDNPEFLCDVAKSSEELSLLTEQTNNITLECSLDFTASNLIHQNEDEMKSLNKSINLDEKLLDPTKEFATAKDIKDNVTVAEITQDLSVTCE